MNGLSIDAFDAIKALTWLASPSGLLVLGLVLLALFAGLARISWLQTRAGRGLARGRRLAWLLVLQLPLLSVPFVAQGLAWPLEERARELAAGAPQIDFDARPAKAASVGVSVGEAGDVPTNPAPPADPAVDPGTANPSASNPSATNLSVANPPAANQPEAPQATASQIAAAPASAPAAVSDPSATLVVDDMPRFDAIVVLGGGMRPSLAGKRQFADLIDAGDRVWHAARLYRTGVAPVIVVSGAGDLIDGQMTPPESEAMRGLLVELGVPESAILLESASRNTRDNAELTAALLRTRLPGAGQAAGQGIGQANDQKADQANPAAPNASARDGKLTVALVTSAMHMPRAMIEFRRAGLPADAYPTDWQVVPDSLPWWRLYLPSGEGLHLAERAIKEWIGRARASF